MVIVVFSIGCKQLFLSKFIQVNPVWYLSNDTDIAFYKKQREMYKLQWNVNKGDNKLSVNNP